MLNNLSVSKHPFRNFRVKRFLKIYSIPIDLNKNSIQSLSFLKIIILLFWLTVTSPVFGQRYYASQQEKEEALSVAKEHMIAQQGDQTILITEPLMIQLKNEGLYDSNFGFRVRMVHGLALYHSTEEVASLDFLWQLKDESRKHKEWSVLANVCRDIAKIQEINQQYEDAYKNLQETKYLIEKYEIDSIYAAFAIRYASWHRVTGNRDSASYYAEIATQKAQKHQQIFEEAEGFLILCLIETDEEDALPYGLRALYLYQKLNVFTSATSMHHNVSNMYLALNNYEMALLHIDTAILYTKKYLNNDDFYNYYNYYLKAYIYGGLGHTDSVLDFTTKSHKAEMRFMESDKQEQIIEISKKYNFEKKSQELNAEKLKSRWLFFSVALFFIFGGIITFYYLKLRKANELSRKQSEELKVLDQTKTRFFANISHELRTPLTLISGSIKTLLKDQQNSQKQEKLLQIAKQGSSNLENLVNEILDLSKMDAGKMELLLDRADAHFFHKNVQKLIIYN